MKRRSIWPAKIDLPVERQMVLGGGIVVLAEQQGVLKGSFCRGVRKGLWSVGQSCCFAGIAAAMPYRMRVLAMVSLRIGWDFLWQGVE